MSLGDLLSVESASVTAVSDVAIVGLIASVQAAPPDLKKALGGAVLVTNGAFGDLNPAIDQLAIALKAEGVGLGNAVKAKLVGLLAARLKEERVFVGEVTIAGVVRGPGLETPGIPLIEGEVIADAFWALYKARADNRARIG